MPPRTRTRVTKVSKENVDVVKKVKAKSDGKITKLPRKALADKTNSLSDDNASIDVPIKTTKHALKNKAAKTISKDGAKLRRDRRLPSRYVENQVLNNLSNNRKTPVKTQATDISVVETSITKPVKLLSSKNLEVDVTVNKPKRSCRLQSAKGPPVTKKPETPSKQKTSTSSPFKTPSQGLDSSLIANRPKRICRLPSRFEDHSISPNKFIPVQPCHASTPIVQKNAKTLINAKSIDSVPKPYQGKRRIRKDKDNVKKDVNNTKSIEHYFSKLQTNKKSNRVKDTSPSPKDKTSPDTNNNPKQKKTLAKRVVSTKSPIKQVSPKTNIKTGFRKRLLANNLSFRVFEDRKSEDKNEDVYEFTFDPNEEPPPQKKKRKRVVKKRPPKPKTVVLLKNNYDENIQKAIESLKSKVKPSVSQNTQPPLQSQSTQPPTIHLSTHTPTTHVSTHTPTNVPTDKKPAGKIQIIEDIIIKPATENKSLNYTPALPANESAKSIHMSNYASINVEDIAADFEVTDTNDINYSPVNSPCRPKTPETRAENYLTHSKQANGSQIKVNNKDPLNLQGDISFFDEQPVASSSMNVSVRHPLASPWRVEFEKLPIKWQADTYVKANMTPAVESSFINSEEISKKKHVYTNMVAEEPLSLVDDAPNLKQTSIISFIREIAERSLKKKRGRSVSPAKANSLFEDLSNTNFGFQTPKKARKENVLSTPNASNSSNDKSLDKEASNHAENHENTNENHKNISNENSNQEKSPIKKQKSKDKDCTFFGFDESESYDQENVSPIKNIQHTRAMGLRSKSRAVLKEINAMSGPTRVIFTAKTKPGNSEAEEKLYDQLKSAEDAPVLPENGKVADELAANDPTLSDDSESVHLFEDIEVVHHMKPHRKSYGKAKKVTFQQKSNSDSDTQDAPVDVRSSDDDDLGDLTFQVPYIEEKKVTKKKKKKKQLSKKEEKEVEKWAAGFNSMCEDIDEFNLVVE